jgi:hypothetical protein
MFFKHFFLKHTFSNELHRNSSFVIKLSAFHIYILESDP